MNIQEHTTPEKLERYSFLWSEVRLIIAAVALFLGGIPPLLFLIRFPSGLIITTLTLSWIISGLSAGYLLYRWSKVRTLFGTKENLDLVAFFVMVVSGINLGLTGIFSTNIGMSISTNGVVFLAVGILYLASAYHLHRRWRANGQKIF
jgi:hypothetical protein